MRILKKPVLGLLTGLLLLGLVACGPGGDSLKAEPSSPMTARDAPIFTTGGIRSEEEESSQMTREPYEPLGTVAVMRDNPALPPGCRPQETAGLLTHFFDAFNRGYKGELSRFFPARAELLPWLYSVNRGSDAEVSVDNRRDLLDYFAIRHAQRDRMRLLSVSVAPGNRSPGNETYADITYSLIRHANDLQEPSTEDGRITIGKSTVECRGQLIMLTSMETLPTGSKSSASFGQCPKSASEESEAAIKACAAS